MKRRILILCICIIIVSLIIPGCSSNGLKSSDMPTSSQAYNSGSYEGESSGFGEVFEDSYQEYKQEAESNTSDQQNDMRKLIKTGEIAVEVRDVDKAYTDIKEIISEIGGFEFSSSYRVQNEYKRLQLILKLPPDRLEEFQLKLGQYVGDGHISRMDIRSDDISSQYYDIDARLKSYKASRDQIQKLLDKAETVEEILSIQNELTRLQVEIDSMQGRINMWDKQVGMATITLYVDEEADPLKHTKTVGWKFSSGQQVLMAMRNGFVNTVNTLYNILVWIFVAIVSLAPILLVAVPIVWIVIRKRKNIDKD